VNKYCTNIPKLNISPALQYSGNVVKILSPGCTNTTKLNLHNIWKIVEESLQAIKLAQSAEYTGRVSMKSFREMFIAISQDINQINTYVMTKMVSLY